MDSIAIITESGKLDEILRNHPETSESLRHFRWQRMVWRADVKKVKLVRDKIIVAEIQGREGSAAQAGQDRYYQPREKASGQDAEVKIER